MAMRIAAPTIPPGHSTVPASLLNACFVFSVVIVSFFPAAYFAGGWIYDANGLGIPTDFVNVWAAGRLVLEGHPALAYDWDVQKHVELALLKQDFPGYFAWHYPPPFLFVAALLAHLPYSAAFIGWVSVSLIAYLAVMRAIIGRPFGLLLALALPMVLSNALVGQNGFLTAALIGGTLYLLPTRPMLSGVCLGLLTYKPQYGLLFPIVLIAAAQWRVFFSAAVTAVALAFVSWLAFGTESWQAFFHWMPMFSQAFLSEGKAPWWKLQSLFSLVRYFGGSEPLAWTFQWILTAAVAVTLATIWRSSVRYSLKAAALAVGALLTTPYLFMYDMVVLAIPVAWLVRLGLAHGFRAYELSALAVAMAFVVIFIFSGLPLGFAANAIVGTLVLRRAGPWWRQAQQTQFTAPATA
ncbi:glycosyltransferase family 87 protein [Bradyrhizobium sp. ARR65]|uniref:glycosyltransferase family 87 protein n=1 Tax=Bradyrhizobium sp. ARR65 TaxID=1040989 RepID=UPI000464651B|nr:glycosyltransferase family 87 protein [Bradyrhizobium sp. ARR65]